MARQKPKKLEHQSFQWRRPIRIGWLTDAKSALCCLQPGRYPMQMTRFIGKTAQRLDAKTIAPRKVKKMGPPLVQARLMRAKETCSHAGLQQ